MSFAEDGVASRTPGLQSLHPRVSRPSTLPHLDSAITRPKRKVVSSACSACRERRQKCDGEKPCSSCLRWSTACVYTLEIDRRRKHLRNRKITALEENSKCLDLLIDTIRAANDHQVAELTRCLRDTSSTAEIDSWLRKIRLKISSPRSISSANVKDRVSLPEITSTLQNSNYEFNPLPLHHSNGGFHPSQSLSHTKFSSSSQSIHDGGQSSLLSAFAGNYRADSILDVVTKSQNWHPTLRARLDAFEVTAFPHLSIENEISISSQGQTSPQGGPNFENFNGSCNWPLIRGLSGSSDIKSNGFSSAIQRKQLQVLEQPEWAILPLAFDDGSPLCRAYMSFWKAAKIMIQKGTAVDVILGGASPYVDLFFQPGRCTGSHNVSNWASSLMSSFTEHDPASRLRSVLLLYKLMKWMIAPSAKNYAELPAYQRPTMAQRLIPHSAAIDLVHRAEVRTSLCQNPCDFLTPALGNSINWPKRIDEAVYVDSETGYLLTTADFERHALNINNWTYSEAYLTTFPELSVLVQVQNSWA